MAKSSSLSFSNCTQSFPVAKRLEGRLEMEDGAQGIETNPLAVDASTESVRKKLLLLLKAKKYPADEIERATNNFSYSNLLNSGGNGEVYFGILNGFKCAIKRPHHGKEDSDMYKKHISNELEIHCQVNHQSIVRFLGHSVFDGQTHIVYEFMPKGSLYQYLHDQDHAGGPTILNWKQRLTITHQIAECLAYLHNSSVPRILHVDVKSENILLDDNLNAKLSDFGHSQIIKPGQSHISMAAEGTPHLIDPYWRKSDLLTDKTDVYSFGILLMELLTRQKAKNLKRDGDGAILVKRRKLMDSVDPSLKVGESEVAWKQMMALGSLAADCLGEHVNDRPAMIQVADKIKFMMNGNEEVF
ncbi:hypothetical protein MRB53_035400 [Persea americana]|uniref:Uncharacterized protein n=1 Tax=Persea americana TaxID=3435 RepID=A0ACC2K4J2_PERAE|nr:hypothetical protein MRB53_035400 [Persea americana]